MIQKNNYINYIKTIDKARDYLENITPLKGDCGLLCGSVCCKKRGPDNPDDFGMWLFPHEDILYKDNNNFKVVNAAGNNSYPFLMCGYSGEKGKENNNFCKREERPLFCRFFPYFPAIEKSKKSKNFGKYKIKIIIHPAALNMCPAISNKLKITSEFSRAVKKAVYVMINNPDISREMLKYLTETGDYLKSMSEFAGRILKL